MTLFICFISGIKYSYLHTRIRVRTHTRTYARTRSLSQKKETYTFDKRINPKVSNKLRSIGGSLSMFKFRLYGSQGEPINEADALGPRLTLFSHTAIASAEHLRIRSITQIISDHKIGT